MSLLRLLKPACFNLSQPRSSLRFSSLAAAAVCRDTAVWTQVPISGVSSAAESLYHITVDVSDSPFLASSYSRSGQYLQVRVPKVARPTFLAIASPPSVAIKVGVFEFLVKSVRGSTAEVLCGLNKGDVVELSQVIGRGFEVDRIEPSRDYPTVLIFATGSGISPIRSLIESGFSASKRSDVRLYYGARNLKTMAYQDRFKDWESSGIEIVPVLSEPDRTWRGESGFVQDAFVRAKKIFDPHSAGALLCGRRQMTEEIRSLLVADGVSSRRILMNLFQTQSYRKKQKIRSNAVEVLENLAYLANASNLVLYFSDYMHFSPSEAANSVTDFMGTAFLLAFLGGFFSDAFFPPYHIYLVSAAIEFLGLILLTVQATVDSLKPPACDRANPNLTCEEVKGGEAGMLFIVLYLVALGVGGIKGSLPSHGAEQFDESCSSGRKLRSTFFNYFVFCLSFGALIAVTLVVWIEDNDGWQWGFGISTVTVLLSILVFLSGSSFYRNKIPTGSPFTTIFKVLISAAINGCMSSRLRRDVASMAVSPSSPGRTDKEVEEKIGSTRLTETPSESLRFFNKAAMKKSLHPSLVCSVQQVEEVKTVIRMLPIFLCTIMLNCCLAQLSTFSVEQATTMNTKIGSLKVPPASLPIFPIIFILVLAPIYDHFIVPFARKVKNSETGITHLQRIGLGLVLSIIAMAAAGLVEIKRKRLAADKDLLRSSEPLPITFLWIGLQYLFLGSADLFTLAGLLEFFFTEAPKSMRSLSTSLSWGSLAVGYYLSSVIVSVVNKITGDSTHQGWLSGSNINQYQLDRFYWLMCFLSGLSFLHYLFWARRFKYRSSSAG